MKLQHSLYHVSNKQENSRRNLLDGLLCIFHLDAAFSVAPVRLSVRLFVRLSVPSLRFTEVGRRRSFKFGGDATLDTSNMAEGQGHLQIRRELAVTNKMQILMRN